MSHKHNLNIISTFTLLHYINEGYTAVHYVNTSDITLTQPKLHYVISIQLHYIINLHNFISIQFMVCQHTCCQITLCQCPIMSWYGM